MKKSLFVALAFVSTGSAFADPISQAAGPAPVIAQSPYTYSIGLTQHRETYTEYGRQRSSIVTEPARQPRGHGAKIMQEKAHMTGIKGSVARRIGETNGKVLLSAEYAFGKADYTGSYMGGSYGDITVGDLRRTLVDVSGMYKYSAQGLNGLTAGVGLGYRRLVDNLQDAGAGGYKRVNERTYLTIALEQPIQVNQWSITPGVQYKHILSSKQRAELTDRDISLEQDSGHGAELSVAFMRQGERVSTVITPFFRIWNMKESRLHPAGLFEPKNDTREVGLAVSVQF
jgi:hypothetical protein